MPRKPFINPNYDKSLADNMAVQYERVKACLDDNVPPYQKDYITQEVFNSCRDLAGNVIALAVINENEDEAEEDTAHPLIEMLKQATANRPKDHHYTMHAEFMTNVMGAIANFLEAHKLKESTGKR